MKKLIFTIALSFACSVFCFAEDVISTYKVSGVELEVQASKPNGGKFTYYIQTFDENASDKDVFLCVESKYVQEFKETLKLVKEKFIEWSEVADKNNVTEMAKELPHSFKNIYFAWFGAKWWFSDTFKNVTPYFVVSPDENFGVLKMVAILKTVSAYSNRYITKEITFLFGEPEEIDTLIDALNEDKVYEHFNSKTQTSDLFQ